MRPWAVPAISPIIIFLFHCAMASDSVTEYSLGDQNIVYELEPMLWNISAGVYEVDRDGSGPSPATFVRCSDKGETIVETNVPQNTIIRSFKDSGNKYYPVMYRLFSYQQLEMLKEISSHCEQQISYTCLGAPLRFDRNATWFESAGFDFPIRTLGTEGHYKGCSCSASGECTSCFCDSAASNSTDSGRFLNEKSGVIKIFAKKILPTPGQALLTLGPLVCHGDRGFSDQFSFTFPSTTDYIELGYRENIRSIEFDFRTAQWNVAKLVSGQGNRQSDFFIALENGHRLRFRFRKDEKYNVTVALEVPTPLNDLKWHRVSLEIVKEEVRLGVDGYNGYKKAEDFIALSMKMFVGGYKEQGMVGCVRNVRMNQKLEAPGFKTGGVKYGCPDYCQNLECHERMHCVEDLVNGTGHCECKNPLTQYGDQCEHDINANSEISFHDASAAFVQYVNDELPANPLNSSIVLSFRTDQRQALLLYAHDQFDNFIQIHLENEYELVLTLNNDTEVRSCRISARLTNEFSKMRWVQVSVKKLRDSVIFEADNIICELKGRHVLSSRPITNFTGNVDEAIFPPHSPVPIIAVHRYTTLFIGGLPRTSGIKSRKDRALRRVYYDTEIPSLLGCIRGLAFPTKNGPKNPLEMKNGAFKVENSSKSW
uniref:Neurexin-4 n=1 Tax=Bursaphelenchus xylophilus TaxID=6326 RepID=A0A1I7SG39_BURXY